MDIDNEVCEGPGIKEMSKIISKIKLVFFLMVSVDRVMSIQNKNEILCHWSKMEDGEIVGWTVD